MSETILTLLLTLTRRVKQLASNVALPFTQEEKDKLAAITNPILFKGRVDTVKALDNIADPETGWLFFVRKESTGNYAEYIFTDEGKWEYVGENSIDLNDYVKKTEHADIDMYGTIKLAPQTNGWGLIISNDYISIDPATSSDITDEKSVRRPITPQRISIMMSNYGIESRDQIGKMLARIAALEAAVGINEE